MFNSHIILKFNIHHSKKAASWRSIFSPTFREGCFLATPYNQNQSLAEFWLKVLLEVIIYMKKRPMSVLIRNNSSFLILVSHSTKSGSCLEMSLLSWNFAWGRQTSYPYRQSTQTTKTSEINPVRDLTSLLHSNMLHSLLCLQFLPHFYFLSPCKYSLLFFKGLNNKWWSYRETVFILPDLDPLYKHVFAYYFFLY